MNKKQWGCLAMALAGALFFQQPAQARGGGHADGHPGGSHPVYSDSGGYGSPASGRRSSYAPGVARDKHGRIARNPRARSDFIRSNPCPSTGKRYGACPGYVVDHVVPLKRGGPDAPSNMQWQTKAAAREKDRTE